ncbi:MAG: hypothetical protein RLZZ515_2413, partial [Cyanobacteriota bacterium]
GQRAAQHGRSTEAEIRLILENAVAPKMGLGSALVAIGQQLGGIELDFPRDKRPVEPATFQPKSGSYPVVGKPDVGFGGPMMGAMRSLM